MKTFWKRLGHTSRHAWAPVSLLLLMIVVLSAIVALGAGPDSESYLPIVVKPEPTPIPEPVEVALVPFATGFSVSTVTDIAHAGDERLFVVEKDGDIQVVLPNGTIQKFLGISNLIKTGNWEEGLLGMAFHPDYANNGYFYVAYTGYPDFRVKLSRFTVSPIDPNVADPATRVDLLSIPKNSEVHNGGDLAFGPDGYLYFPIGDGGPDPKPPGDPDAFPGDPDNHGQRTDELLAGILRIDVDKAGGVAPDCGSGNEYTIPADNPYVGRAGCDEIWATGLRNPWRVSFDRDTGDLWIADVGEWQYEEVNLQPAGSPGGINYGWHCYEGTLDYTTLWPSIASDCSATVDYIPPISEYGHNGGCSITGGFVYRGQQFPSLQGQYLFADFCYGKIWGLASTTSGWESTLLYDGPNLFTTFGEDVDGELYVAAHLDGTIYHVVVP